jgi:hypothetical protein
MDTAHCKDLVVGRALTDPAFWHGRVCPIVEHIEKADSAVNFQDSDLVLNETERILTLAAPSVKLAKDETVIPTYSFSFAVVPIINGTAVKDNFTSPWLQVGEHGGKTDLYTFHGLSLQAELNPQMIDGKLHLSVTVRNIVR